MEDVREARPQHGLRHAAFRAMQELAGTLKGGLRGIKFTLNSITAELLRL